LSSPPEQLRIKLGRRARIGGQQFIPAKLAMFGLCGVHIGYLVFLNLCLCFLLRQIVNFNNTTNKRASSGHFREMFFFDERREQPAVTKQYANGTGQILPLLQSRKPKKGGSPKKWQNFGKYFRFSSDFRRLKSSLNRL
jgi:hypothetical protein